MSTTTTNYELLKPSGSERPDIDIINNNMDTLDEELVVGTTNDIITSSVTSSTGWTDANPITLGEKFQSAMTKISTMIKNLKWIYKFIGSTDISSIGNGTITNAISTINSSKLNVSDVKTSLADTSTTHALSTASGKVLNDALTNKVRIYKAWSELTNLDSLTLYQVLTKMEERSIFFGTVTPSQITNLKMAGELFLFRAPDNVIQKSLIVLTTATQSATGMQAYMGFVRYDNHAVTWYPVGNYYYKDVTGTTAASGNITLDLNPSNYMITGLRVGSSSQGIALPWSAGTSWYARVLNTDGSAKANTNVTIRVEYKNLAT